MSSLFKPMIIEIGFLCFHQADIMRVFPGYEFFLLENVPGILTHGKQFAGIEGGLFLFMIKAAMESGHQILVATADAAMHGTPEVRRRLIFIFSTRDRRLPDFPAPTHFVPNWLSSPGVKGVRPRDDAAQVLAYKDPEHAANPPVTILEALSDLPPFEYSDPHLVIPSTAPIPYGKKTGDTYGDVDDLRLGIRAFGQHAQQEDDGSQSYGQAPRSNYQLRMRNNNGGTVTQHYTSYRADLGLLEAICKVPLIPNMSFLDLPKELRTKATGGKKNDNEMAVRPHALGLFRTVSATIQLGQKQNHFLHPWWRRPFSVRELARAQGFPDHVHFSGGLRSQISQIGNAVPVPLSNAIAKEIMEAQFRAWNEERKAVAEQWDLEKQSNSISAWMQAMKHK